MRPQSPEPERRVDSDGVTHITPARTNKGLGAWLVGGACVITLACIGLSVWWGSSDIEVEAPPPFAEVPPSNPSPAPEVRARAPRPRPPPVVAAAPQPVAEPELDTDTDVQEPDMESQPTGLQLYRPGTKPLLRGLIVPDDFELPPGYVRHFQYTDSGELVAAVLTFHPDHQPTDRNGQPVPMPPDRLVPEELAPPGMPIQRLDLAEGAEFAAPSKSP
ncbi:hypothetical protein [Comamonas sp. JC664]|uniref:hypothetical protein n=1 Tax=Comamonas sp. JC664 TaxID=2801917 RepID=UPI001748214A|nr:hypothetical protein [Comamonas sp. JC664]MBL0698264.1 hypothetical protein [Comamonas sp. JC664]GHG89247.1 hypothetical protein GCM10012319_48520 [Comamonas sp. KCTC 72670]